MYTLRRSLTVPGSLETVFNFFNRPENLERLTPDTLKFNMLTPSPVTMHNGAVFDYTIGLMGLPMRWTSVITNYDPPHHFVDVQLKGPYAYWHHKHSFQPRGDDVEVTDEIHYEIGFSLFGKVLLRPLVQRQLKSIFAFRAQAIEQLFRHPEASQPDDHEGVVSKSN